MYQKFITLFHIMKCHKVICIILAIAVLIASVCAIDRYINPKYKTVLDYRFGKTIPETIEVAGKNYPVRHFEISAISLRIVYNDAGDHDPNGMIFVLNENKEEVLRLVQENPTTPQALIEPLVIRANAGDVIVVDFYNELSSPASIHIASGALTNVQQSDGAAIGKNTNTTTTDRIRYVWYAPDEGTYLFNDMSDMRSTEDSKNIHGLFGVLAVEKAGSTWTHPETGEPLKSGTHADIHHPLEEDFREFVKIFHDEPEIKDINGVHPISHETHMQESTMPIAYRAEPMRNRSRSGGRNLHELMGVWGPIYRHIANLLG